MVAEVTQAEEGKTGIGILHDQTSSDLCSLLTNELPVLPIQPYAQSTLSCF